MKRKNTFLLALSLCTLFSIASYAESPKREFRATWLTTAMNIDWPKTYATSTTNRNKQKTALTDILDNLVEANMNAVCFQVRSRCDAMYQSSYEPWCDALTGSRGTNPGYDPLAFVITEAHKRGLEVHAWVNPFRYETSANAFGTSDQVRKNHANLIISYNNGTFAGTILDPGIPETRQYITNVIKEIVQNYDIDGVIFDDYFYPYGGTTTEDAASKAKYKTNASQSDGDWRRENIDKAMKAVYDMIQSTKPYVRFGIAPSGIWTMNASAAAKYGISLPAGITGFDAYEQLACNTISWMDGGYVDYVAPQIYWSTTAEKHSYITLTKWWSDMAKLFTDKRTDGKKIHFYSSNATYKITDTNHPDFTVPEMGLEVDYNRQYDRMGAPGAIFYNTNTFISEGLPAYLKANTFTQEALPPAIDWKQTTTLAAPTNLTLSGSTLSWTHPTAERFTVYAYTKGSADPTTAMASSSNLVGVVYGKSLSVSSVSGYASKTFAVCAYDRYGNEYTPGLYNAEAVNAVVKASTSSITLSAKQGDSPAPYADVTITASELLTDLSITTSGPLSVATLSGWNARTGGKIRITLNTSNEIGTYSGSVTVYSGSAKAVISVSAVLSNPDVKDGIVTFDPNALWTQTPSTLSCLSTAGNNRSMAYYDGKLYITDKAAGAYHIINASTGAFQQTDKVGYTDFEQHNIRITQDGQMLFGNTGSASSASAALKLRAWNMNTETMTALGTFTLGSRTDYFYPYGKWNDAGFLMVLSNTGKLMKISYAGGALGSAQTLSTLTLKKEPNGDGAKSAKAIPASSTAFYSTATHNIPVKYSVSGTTVQKEEEFGDEQPASVGASGLGLFSLHGHQYMITPTDSLGGFDIFDITDGLASATRVISPTPKLGTTKNTAMTIDYCTRVVGDDAYIYELVPDNGLRAYKFTFTPKSTATVLEDVATQAQVLPTLTGVSVFFEGTERVAIYTVNGTQLMIATATNGFTFDLPQGAYIIRVGTKAYKFVK